jgi:UDPglucose 6-dehydrogenase
MKRVAIFGAGYVGLSSAVLFSQRFVIDLIDIDKNKINSIKLKNLPIREKGLNKIFLKNYKKFNFYSMSEKKIKNLDTTNIENLLKQIYKYNNSATIVIKSTLPIGFSKKIEKKFSNMEIYYIPEFLREGSAVYDQFYPNRIIIGSKNKKPTRLAKILKKLVLNSPNIQYTTNQEAELIKLFSNTFLASRISFFNEVDTYCMELGLNTESIITGMCFDERIGSYYNNPSFGFGGYCLPKDVSSIIKSSSKNQLSLIHNINNSNRNRTTYIANHILEIIKKRNIKKIGIYRINMKKESDNYRSSSIIQIVKKLMSKNLDIIIYEPLINEEDYLGSKIVNNLEYFKTSSALVIANRIDKNLSDIKDKVFSRDLFHEN